MPSVETAEQRFRNAFERLKADRPQVLAPGTAISQNNVAKEAGTDPTALRKARYPDLIRDIQEWVANAEREKTTLRKRRARQRSQREALQAQLHDLKLQRDHAQAELLSAHRLVLELLQENASLRTQLENTPPQPTPIRK
jgi:chromosome segregation ATPase